jgi:PadR family transcriptional regulator AphA
VTRSSRADSDLLLGEWACLGIVAQNPTHGFAVAGRLKNDGDIGRIWSLTRPLTYRALDHLVDLGYLETVREEQGVAGGSRTILRATRSGRSALRNWLTTPSEHLRDLRSEFLLKITLCELHGVDQRALVGAQKKVVARILRNLRANTSGKADLVTLWRIESGEAARRFLDQLS